MNTIVYYYSKKGSNRYLAGKIAERLSCEKEEIRPRLDVFLLYLLRINLGHKSLKHKINDYDKVILCGPIWIGKLIPPLRNFLLKHKESIQQLTFVTCCGSSDAKKDDKFGHGFVFKEVENIMKDKLTGCQAFPIDLVLPDYKKEDEEATMNTRLSDETFNGIMQERLDTFVAQVSQN